MAESIKKKEEAAINQVSLGGNIDQENHKDGGGTRRGNYAKEEPQQKSPPRAA
jgi:hypothetical protein